LNPEDMNDLVDAHGAVVYRYCVRLAGNRQQADELFQQTFLRAVELANRIDPARNPVGFLLAVAAKTHRRNAVKAGRRQRIAPQAAVGEDGDAFAAVPDPGDLEADVGQRELRLAVRGLVQALPEKLRTPVIMHYTGGLGVAEIAGAMGIRQGTVKSRLFKARQVIRAGLEAKGYGPEAF
jgi:RNA polymerase sigma-70 factor, ECF subfamily